MKKFLFLLLLKTVCSFSQTKVVDTINATENFNKWKEIAPSTNKYIRYIEEEKKVKLLDLWTRKVSFSGKGENSVLVVSQKWESSDLKKFREIRSVSERKTFRPLTHKRFISEKGLEAYEFSEKEVKGMEDVPNNLENGFIKSYNIMPFNFEMDFEILSSLPLQKNYKAVIKFYHPGGAPPKYHTYEVIGEEKLPVVESMIDTWVLYTDYGGRSPTKLWISKKNNKVIKQESSFDNKKLYKVLLY